MTSLRECRIGGETYFWAKTLSGYPTKPFSSERKAFIEEEFLNRKWIDAQEFFLDCHLQSVEWRDAAHELLRFAMHKLCIGMIKVDSLSEYPEYEIYDAMIAEDKPPLVVAFLDDELRFIDNGHDTQALIDQIRAAGRSDDWRR